MSMTFMPVQLNNSSIKQKSLVDEKNHIRRNKFSIVTSGKKGTFIKKNEILKLSRLFFGLCKDGQKAQQPTAGSCLTAQQWVTWNINTSLY
jgi:hypothetical protein